MKKKIISVLCIILVFVMTFNCASTAFAANNVTPVVMVHGMGAFGLYKNPNTPKEEKLADFDIASLLGDSGLLRQLLRVATGNDVKPQDIIDSLAYFMSPYEDIACDENGNSPDNIGIASYWEDSLANHRDWLECKNANEPAIYRQVCDKVGAKNVYAFNYDWRLDACENADKLNDFINTVKAKTGKSKVTLVGGSEGTVVASAYIDKYKNKNDIKKLVLINGAFCGVGVANAFKQDLYINEDVLMEYVEQFCLTYNGSDINTDFLSILISLLPGVVNSLCNYLNDVIDDKAVLSSVYNDVLKPLGNIPVLWEFIPYDSFYSAVNKMSKIGFLDKNSGLYDKIVRYHNVQGRIESNLKSLKSKGVQIAIIANYGTPGIPITSGYKDQTDILIDTKYASAGATVADYGKKLNRSGKYVSEDKIIDASTCILPDNTWFIKSIQHMNFWYNTEANKFLANIITTDKVVSVQSMKKEFGYNQFLGTDNEQRIISVLNCGTDSLKENDEFSLDASQIDSKKQMKSPETYGNSFVIPVSLIAIGLGAIALAFRKRKNLAK